MRLSLWTSPHYVSVQVYMHIDASLIERNPYSSIRILRSFLNGYYAVSNKKETIVTYNSVNSN